MMLDVAKAVPLFSGSHVLHMVSWACECSFLCGTVMRGTWSSVLNAAFCVCLTSCTIHVKRMCVAHMKKVCNVPLVRWMLLYPKLNMYLKCWLSTEQYTPRLTLNRGYTEKCCKAYRASLEFGGGTLQLQGYTWFSLGEWVLSGYQY